MSFDGDQNSDKREMSYIGEGVRGYDPLVVTGREYKRWEESCLAKFSEWLGFSEKPQILGVIFFFFFWLLDKSVATKNLYRGRTPLSCACPCLVRTPT